MAVCPRGSVLHGNAVYLLLAYSGTNVLKDHPIDHNHMVSQDGCSFGDMFIYIEM